MTARTTAGAVCAALLLICAAGPAAADDDDRTISVTGTGRAAAPPDTATVAAGVITEASAAGAAVRSNNEQVADLFAALRDAGIADADLQTRSFNVSPRYGRPQPDGSPRIEGYRAANTVSVRVRRLGDLGRLLDRMIGAGANQLNGIRFYIDDPEPLLDEARRAAIADARRKAEIYAAAAGVEVGRVISIGERSSASPQPVLRSIARASSDESVPVAGGEQTLEISVSVTYALE